MSQAEVYKILKELEGEATTREIRERAKEKFPNLSLYQYVGNRLRKLEKKGYIIRAPGNNGKIRWKITQQYP